MHFNPLNYTFYHKRKQPWTIILPNTPNNFLNYSIYIYSVNLNWSSVRRSALNLNRISTNNNLFYLFRIHTPASHNMRLLLLKI